MKRNLITMLNILICFSGIVTGQIIYIPGDYLSIQEGINAAAEGDTVLVSEGIYFENISFKGKAITVSSEFLMDGDTSHISSTIINGSRPSHPDTASVVTFWSGEDTTSILTGFTITGGSGILWKGDAAYPQPDIKIAAGILIWDAGAKISDNIIEDNHISHLTQRPSSVTFDSLSYGAGIAALAGTHHNLVIKNNTIRNNSISSGNLGAGAGIFLAEHQSEFIDINGNEIRGNTVQTTYGMALGGGIGFFNEFGKEGIPEIYIRNNIISHNAVSGNREDNLINQDAMGGGIFINGKDNPANYSIYNNILSQNHSNFKGGGIGIEFADLLMINNTFTDNQAILAGNSIWIRYTEGFVADPTSTIYLVNNIMWSENNNVSEIAKDGRNTLFASHNLIRGGWEGDHNLNTDPLLDEITFELMENSPCVGTGIDSVQVGESWYPAPAIDLLGAERPHPVDNRVDLGAIESPAKGAVSSRNQILPPQIFLYPNPTKDYINIHPKKPGVYTLKIVSTTGQVVHFVEFSGNDKKLDLTSFQNGVYCIVLRSEHYISTHKIVKQ